MFRLDAEARAMQIRTLGHRVSFEWITEQWVAVDDTERTWTRWERFVLQVLERQKPEVRAPGWSDRK